MQPSDIRVGKDAILVIGSGAGEGLFSLRSRADRCKSRLRIEARSVGKRNDLGGHASCASRDHASAPERRACVAPPGPVTRYFSRPSGCSLSLGFSVFFIGARSRQLKMPVTTSGEAIRAANRGLY